MSEYGVAYIRAARFQVLVFEGEVSNFLFYGKILEGKREYVTSVSSAMINAALAERDRLMAEQVAELIKERDALKDELETAKEALQHGQPVQA